jgi:hypothetical protein
MDPAQVSPLVGWLSHDSCPVTGEIYVAMGGRMARAYMAESRGVYRPEWSVEQVAADSAVIRDGEQVVFPAAPNGQLDHLLYGFGMIRDAG